MRDLRLMSAAIAAAVGCGGVVDRASTEEGAGASSASTTGDPQGPKPATCAGAQRIDLASGSIVIQGDTMGVPDEHPSITCDSPNVAFSFDQGQLYYLFEVRDGFTYHFALESSFYGFVYVFPSSVGCAADAIEAACSSDGEVGMVSPIVNPGSTAMSFFDPKQPGDYVIAVDGDTSPGPFTLTVTEK